MAAETRFSFGRNWADYASQIGEKELIAAVDALSKLLPAAFDPAGKSFLDIGAGSGLHSVAAHRMGFNPITATDYDDDSVATTKATAAKFNAGIDVFRDDILSSKLAGQWDVVYSWGVLHHTGSMAQAIRYASEYVKPRGLFIIAIYLKTPLCGFWKIEKQIYSRMPSAIQYGAAYAFRGLAYALKAVDTDVEKQRGMNWFNDAKDWLGGYPYESASPNETLEMIGREFSLLQSFNTKPGPGILGSGCAEYVLQRNND